MNEQDKPDEREARGPDRPAPESVPERPTITTMAEAVARIIELESEVARGEERVRQIKDIVRLLDATTHLNEYGMALRDDALSI